MGFDTIDINLVLIWNIKQTLIMSNIIQTYKTLEHCGTIVLYIGYWKVCERVLRCITVYDDVEKCVKDINVYLENGLHSIYSTHYFFRAVDIHGSLLK